MHLSIKSVKVTETVSNLFATFILLLFIAPEPSTFQFFSISI